MSESIAPIFYASVVVFSMASVFFAIYKSHVRRTGEQIQSETNIEEGLPKYSAEDTPPVYCELEEVSASIVS